MHIRIAVGVRYLFFSTAFILVALTNWAPGRVSAQSAVTAVISEVHPAGSGNGTYAADWFEVTNTGALPLSIAGWRMDDNSNGFATALPLRGVTSIPTGKSAVFFEGLADGSTDATLIAKFAMAWFGSPIPPRGFLIGAYGGSGAGLGTGGDAVNLFDAAGNRITGVSFGAASATTTFDNASGLGSTTLPLPGLTTLSVAGVNGAFLSFNGTETGSPGRLADPPSLSGVDLSRYVRVGRFDLPEPTRTAAPPNSLLAQEVSAVTYDWDTDTLFVVGDGGTSIVQVSKTGLLIDSMTLAPGGSPQGTDFYDTEGLTYVGGGKFVMVEERDRQAVLFTYVPGTTLTRALAQTVKLGTFAPNIGIEGMSYDPSTGEFIAVKEAEPQGIFQTGIDFAAGTATNGSATTENSIDLFDPSLVNLLDFADVFALSNLPSLTGPDAGHLLVLSQESGQIVNVDRQGSIFSSLTIANDAGNPLSIAAQQHEGLTMDFDGYLYVVSENGGGDFDHPQLWVYAPSAVPNQPPAALTLTNQTTSIVENSSTTTRIKVADIVITDDGLGANVLTVTGADAGFFDADVSGLYIKAGTTLDFETKASYSVVVQVDDAAVGASPDATAPYALAVTDAPETTPSPAIVISEVAPWGSGNSPYAADWFEVTNTSASAVNIAGWKVDDNSSSFGAAISLSGITSIGAGESVIFIETSNLAAAKAAFLSTWFGTSLPADLQVGGYSGSGVGLSTSGDAVNLYDSTGALKAAITLAASPASAPFATFDNAAGLNNTAVSQLSAAGVLGAFVASNDASEIGSPGRTANPPAPPAHLIISEVAPWSSGNSPVGADWFEVTNIGSGPADITGWKVDDSSESPVAAVALNGISSLAPGESVIFIETADAGGARQAFLNTWFGANPPAALQIGSYSGSGIGLSTGGDAVNLYDSSGVLRAKVFFASSPAGPLFPTFDNTAGLNDAAISQLSVAGVHGAFVAAADGTEIGSPGTTAADTIPPVLAPIANILTSTSGSSAVVTFAPSAMDNVSAPANIAVLCLPPSGGAFAIGTTSVSCRARDEAGNESAPISFSVTVNRLPVAVPDVASTLEGVAVSIPVVANDTDGDGDTLILASAGTPLHGAAAIGSGAVVYTPAADFHGTDMFPYVVSDGHGGSASGTVTVTVSRLGRFVALSRDLTWMRAGSTAVTGDVGAIERRSATHGGDRNAEDGDLDAVTVRLGVDAALQQSSSRVVGDTVLLQTRSSIANLIDNVLLARKNSTIRGTTSSPMTTPFVALPAFPAVQAGTQAVSVAKNKTATLAPGAYGEIRVAAGATLVLSGGHYQVKSLDLGASASVVFHSATELRVATWLATRAKARLILDPSVAGLTASQVVIYVAGRDEECPGIEPDDDGDDAGPVTVQIGTQNVVQANIFAERGTVWLKSKTRATGAFIGLHVRIGVNAELTLDSAFR